MTAIQLLDLMRLGGYTVRLNGNRIEVTQARWIDEELAHLILQHKQGLIELLKIEAKPDG